jgi:N-acetylglucosamine kinase-like BadF-type ATPase
MFELIGHPIGEQSGANISQQHVAHLIQVVDKSKNKRLLRDQFINITNNKWTDGHNGIGALLIEHRC